MLWFEYSVIKLGWTDFRRKAELYYVLFIIVILNTKPVKLNGEKEVYHEDKQ